MLLKLNDETPPQLNTSPCDLTNESSENQIQFPIDGTDGVRQKIINYKSVMVGNFKVPENVFFSNIPINIGHLLSFISKNWEGLSGIRIYFSKMTEDQLKNDYELVIVPCTTKSDANGQPYYEDMLQKSNGSPSNIISIKCRKPPGCPGALLV